MAMGPSAAVALMDGVGSSQLPSLPNSTSLVQENSILPPCSALYLATRSSACSMQLMPNSSQCFQICTSRSGVCHAVISSSIICDRCEMPSAGLVPIIKRETICLPKRTIGIEDCCVAGCCASGRRIAGWCAEASAAKLETTASDPIFCRKSRREFSPVRLGLDFESTSVRLLCGCNFYANANPVLPQAPSQRLTGIAPGSFGS